MQAKGNYPHCFYVRSDIFASRTVAPGRGLNENSIFIAQANSETIKFQLCRVLNFRNT